MTSPFSSPPVHRGMMQIQPELFEASIQRLAARIPASKTTHYREQLKQVLFNVKKLPTVLPDPDSQEHRLLLLNAEQRDEILRAVLPEELCNDLPTAFTIAGHLAHMNLTAPYLPYRYLIGQVILDKNPNLQTVVNKVDTIDTEFRFFKMEVIAGIPKLEVQVSQHGCTYRFDFSKVYWNSRLEGEHGQLVNSFKPTDVVCDGFAGVGPFAIPAAKKGCAVYANDLNPASANSLKENVKLNKVQDRVQAYNMDGGEVVKTAVAEAWHQPIPPRRPKPKTSRRSQAAVVPAQPAPVEPVIEPSRLIDHFIMNLPATAIEFLGCYRGIYRSLMDQPGFMDAVRTPEGDKTPMVHCYCFSNAQEGAHVEQICERATKYLKHPVGANLKDFAITHVRSVAPAKDMYRLSFRLPLAVLLAED